MEEAIRKSKVSTKQGASRTTAGARSETQTRLMYERRPLKTVSLTPPDYKVHPQVLRDSYLEKEVRYAGVVPDIPVHLDATNRTDVLRVIDRGKREQKVAWTTSYEHDAIFCLNAQNVKISKRDGHEELLLRLPVHEVAAICYIRDDDQHILGIKSGNLRISRGLDEAQDTCQLVVMYCDSRGSAEELCSLIGQCFQLVYTEATMHFLDMRVDEAAAGLSIGNTTLRSDRSDTSTPKRERGERSNLGFLSYSSLDLEHSNGGTTSSSGTSRSLPRTAARRSSMARSEDELSPAATDMIQDYMKKLYKKLNTDELRRFAMLVRAWHSTMSITDFCENVMDLYGPERKHLLLGMRPFIPDKDIVKFETFLEKIGLNSTSIWSDSMSSGMKQVYRRTYSGTGTFNGGASTGDEYDVMLNEISHDIENLGTSVELGGGATGGVGIGGGAGAGAGAGAGGGIDDDGLGGPNT